MGPRPKQQEDTRARKRRSLSYYAKAGLRYAALGATILAVGAISAAGIFYLTNSLPLAGVAFVLGGFVEADVFRDNIFKGIRDLPKNQARLIRRAKIKNALDALFINLSQLQSIHDQITKRLETLTDKNTPFATELQLQLESFNQKIAAQKELLSTLLGNNLFAEFFRIRQMLILIEQHEVDVKAGEQEKLEHQLNVLLDALWMTLKNRKQAPKAIESHAFCHDDYTRFERESSALLETLDGKIPHFCDKLFKTIRRNVFFQYLNVVISAGAVFNFYFTSAFLSSQFLVYLGASSALTAALPGGICAIAALGYGLLVYTAMKDIIAEGKLEQFLKAQAGFFKKQPYQTRAQHIGKVIAVSFSLLIMFTIIAAASAATAMTWYYITPQGFELLNISTTFLTHIISTATTAMASFAEMCFSVVAGIGTLCMMPKTSLFKTLTHPIKHFSQLPHKLSRWWAEHKDENLVQKLNPFRPLSAFIGEIGKLALFIGHIISEGADCNRVPHWDPVLLTGFDTANVLLSDPSFLFDVDGATQVDPILHASSLIDTSDLSLSSLKDKSCALIKAKKEAATERKEMLIVEPLNSHSHAGHDHSHGLLDQLVFLIRLPFNLLSDAWYLLFGGFKKPENTWTYKTISHRFSHHHHNNPAHDQGGDCLTAVVENPLRSTSHYTPIQWASQDILRHLRRHVSKKPKIKYFLDTLKNNTLTINNATDRDNHSQLMISSEANQDINEKRHPFWDRIRRKKETYTQGTIKHCCKQADVQIANAA